LKKLNMIWRVESALRPAWEKPATPQQAAATRGKHGILSGALLRVVAPTVRLPHGCLATLW
jgi:hypothetical protein